MSAQQPGSELPAPRPGDDAPATTGRSLAGALLFAAAIALVYWPVLRNGFVWDDWENLVAHRGWRSLDLDGLVAAFRSRVGGHFQPLTWLSWALDDLLWRGDPRGYHAVNVLLHVANALLVLRLAERLLAAAERPEGERRLGALLAAALFAFHPMRVESVAWATERRDVLSAFFALASLLAWVEGGLAERRGDAGPARRWRLASLGAFAVGLLAKSIAPLPAVLLVLDLHPLGRHRRGDGGRLGRLARLLVEKVPFLALSLASSVLAVRAQAATGALVGVGDQGLAARAAQAAFGLCHYLVSFFTPVRSPLVERPVPLDPLEPRFVAAMAAVLVAGGLLVAARRRAPGVVAAAVAYLLLLLPVLGLFQSGVQLVADRYSYLPHVGFAVVAGGAVAAAMARWGRVGRGGAVLLVAGLLAFFALASRRQVAVWKDDQTLWRAVLASGPSALAENNLGAMALGAGRTAEAVDHLLASLAVAPGYHRPWTNLRKLLEARPADLTPDQARRIAGTLSRSLEFQKGSPTAHYIVGLALERQGDLEGARRSLRTALALRPVYPEARRLLEQVTAKVARP